MSNPRGARKPGIAYLGRLDRNDRTGLVTGVDLPLLAFTDDGVGVLRVFLGAVLGDEQMGLRQIGSLIHGRIGVEADLVGRSTLGGDRVGHARVDAVEVRDQLSTPFLVDGQLRDVVGHDFLSSQHGAAIINYTTYV